METVERPDESLIFDTVACKVDCMQSIAYMEECYMCIVTFI